MRATTVVVARNLRPGREREGERWIERIRGAAASAPGFLAADVHPPDDAHPDEWIVVYSFATASHLDAWLHSPARAQLVESSHELFAGEVREQRLAMPPASHTVTLVSSITLEPGCEDRHGELHDACIRAARHLGGLVRSELLPAVPGVQAETVALLTFASRADLDRWLGSAEREEVLAAMEELATGPRTLNVIGGFAGWLSPGPGISRRWKQALVVLAGLVPVSMLTALARTNALPHAPLPAAVGLTALANTLILTWLVMPQLTRRLQPWLTKGAR